MFAQVQAHIIQCRVVVKPVVKPRNGNGYRNGFGAV